MTDLLVKIEELLLELEDLEGEINEIIRII